jgi:hypothetical protein
MIWKNGQLSGKGSQQRPQDLVAMRTTKVTKVKKNDSRTDASFFREFRTFRGHTTVSIASAMSGT